MAKITFLGPEGTFTHEAVQHWTGPSDRIEPLVGVADVYRSVETGTAEYGVVPIENTVEGYVIPSLDLLLASPNIRAIGQVNIDITFSAFSLADSRPAHTIVSHPHALAQCSSFIERMGLPTRATTSTAAASRDLDEGELAISAAICGPLYGRHLVASQVEDFSGARTRFLLLAQQDFSSEASKSMVTLPAVQTMLAVTPSVAGPGVLARITNGFADGSINLTSIITRPLKAREGRYAFVFTLDGHPAGSSVRTAIEGLIQAGDYVKLLGVFEATHVSSDFDIFPSIPRGSLHQGDSREMGEAFLWD